MLDGLLLRLGLPLRRVVLQTIPFRLVDRLSGGWPYGQNLRLIGDKSGRLRLVTDSGDLLGTRVGIGLVDRLRNRTGTDARHDQNE